jgi:hypothetical protein
MILHAASTVAFFVDQLGTAPVMANCAQSAPGPDWKWWVSALAPWIGPLLSGMVSIYVAWRVFRWQGEKEHNSWVRDQKKAEYRELVDLLYDAITVVVRERPCLAPPKDPQLLNNAVQKLARVFEDRFFIVKRLRESGAYEQWLEMKQMIYYDPDLHAETPQNLHYSKTGLWLKETELRAKLIELANADIVAFRGGSSGGY